MMRRVLAWSLRTVFAAVFAAVFGVSIIVSFAVPGAFAQSFPDTQAKASEMPRADKRFLQGYLAILGAYSGRLDGKWNDDSQQAFDQYTRSVFGDQIVTWRHVALITRQFEAGLASGGWQVYFDDTTNMSFLLPSAIMRQQAANTETVWLDVDGELLIRSGMADEQSTRQKHQWLADVRVPNAADATLRKPDRLVTSGLLPDRINTTYIRSKRVRNNFGSVFLQWRPQKAAVARLIVASVAGGEQQPLAMAENGPLRRAVLAVQQGPTGTVPQTDPQAPEEPVRNDGLVGTGFYINNTDIVTAISVLEECKQVQTLDATKFSVIARNQMQGLAVLTSAARSDHWLTVNANVASEPGQVLATLGIQPRDGAFRGLAGTRGQIWGDTGANTNGTRLNVSMHRQVGTQGAPVFDSGGGVVGVLVYGPDQHEGAGSLVVPIRRLATTLARNRITFQTQSSQANLGPQTSAQSDPAQAIVPLFCQ